MDSDNILNKNDNDNISISSNIDEDMIILKILLIIYHKIKI